MVKMISHQSKRKLYRKNLQQLKSLTYLMNKTKISISSLNPKQKRRNKHQRKLSLTMISNRLLQPRKSLKLSNKNQYKLPLLDSNLFNNLRWYKQKRKICLMLNNKISNLQRRNKKFQQHNQLFKSNSLRKEEDYSQMMTNLKLSRNLQLKQQLCQPNKKLRLKKDCLKMMMKNHK